jgi:hypothetical protein
MAGQRLTPSPKRGEGGKNKSITLAPRSRSGRGAGGEGLKVSSVNQVFSPSTPIRPPDNRVALANQARIDRPPVAPRALDEDG